mgnify:CR=1 FL=1
MDALHGRDYSQLSKTRDIRRVDMLSMLDAVAHASVTPIKQCIENIKDFSVSAIPNRVDANLESILVSGVANRLHILNGHGR